METVLFIFITISFYPEWGNVLAGSFKNTAYFSADKWREGEYSCFAFL